MTATDKSQAQRLLACGVDPYKADMTLSHHKNGFYELMATPFHYGCFDEKDLPAWSLGTLLTEVLPKIITRHGFDYSLSMRVPPNWHEWEGWVVGYLDRECDAYYHMTKAPDPIEACVRMVEKLKEEGMV